MTESFFPTSYREWRECITVRCHINLTAAYIERRLRELRNAQHAETRRFTELYGSEYTQRVVEWFEIAHHELQH